MSGSRRTNNNASTEETILSKIPGYVADDNDAPDAEDLASQDNAQQGGGGNVRQTEDDQVDDEGFKTVEFRARTGNAREDQPASGANKQQAQDKQAIDPKTGKPVAQPKEQFADPLQHRGAWKQDAKGNVVNKDGHIIARAGNERRLFEKGRMLEQRLETAGREVQTYKTKIKELSDAVADMKVLGGQPAALGLSPEESYAGLRLVAMYKESPEKFFRYVVDQLTKSGHDVTKFGGPQGAGVNPSPAAIQALIQQSVEKALGPIKQTRERVDEEARANEEAKAEAEAFFERNPDAAIHESDLARLLLADETLTPDAAYWKLKSFALENGLDFSQPLAPQYNAKQGANGQGNGQQRTPQQPRRQQPMPNGRAASDATISERRTTVNSPDDDYAKIIAEAMAESGMTRQ